jgi:hypothetical protein
MSNRALWNVRLRHVWMSTPLKAGRNKKRSRTRVGQQAAIDRKGGPATDASADGSQDS